MASLLASLVEALTPPKVQATHRGDGSVGELLLKWSGNYRVRWFEGPRAGTVAYERIPTVSLREMPRDHAFPPTPRGPRPDPGAVEGGLGI